ncbi:MAG: flagellum-specific ATP synthase FliI, partial [Burkholderiales bacterium]
AEGDDQQDPVADNARAILDGHIVLSRRIAESGRYPAIDTEQSISRVMANIASPAHRDSALRFKGLVSRLARNQDLISVGAYVPGTDPLLDEAIAKRPLIEGFLAQGMLDQVTYTDSVRQLTELIGPTTANTLH